MKLLLFFSFVFFSFNLVYSQPDSIVMPFSAFPWNVKLDLSRFMSRLPSAQVSVAYRYSKHIEFESELNYYLKYSAQERREPLLDELNLSLNKGKPNLFLSGLLKGYLGDWSDFYLGLRGAVGVVNFNLSRAVCTDSEKSPSGNICRCKSVETRSLDVKKIFFLKGIRIGFNGYADRITYDLYMDLYGASNQVNTNYDVLKHKTCGEPLAYEWRDIYYRYRPKRDGLFEDVTGKEDGVHFLIGLKIGYEF